MRFLEWEEESIYLFSQPYYLTNRYRFCLERLNDSRILPHY